MKFATAFALLAFAATSVVALGTVQCPPTGHIYIADPEDCHYFHVCTDGQELDYIKGCKPHGDVFDYDLNPWGCVPPDESDCKREPLTD
ncbi:hypothetical protein BOTBODRAFT_37488 [Botryobasidium botryosum FD-172 SS1]|uniref:Chitin-binding type-2 domain-containing protein n=1 Tax=Botryobasidium botryosum (strain FD-172 SS1) TaxID=930990 RepID=A0A067MBK1_BOTB1|nr:hypothetical protein BOTBODRAFT_37488 [Botryobasidium botryosum FD-172 SS1]